jgi:hypothetical protein
MTNIQARVQSRNGYAYAWEDYGDVTHIAAAEQHARRYPFSHSVIETRDETRGVIFAHESVKVIEYRITPMRRDDAADDYDYVADDMNYDAWRESR